MNSLFSDVCIVVPSRLGSSRLKEKPLADICGAPMVVRVYENLAPLVKEGANVVVATDSEKIIDVCDKYGIKSVMTSPNHSCGTSRCLEAARNNGGNYNYVLNIQGDEPFLEIEPIKNLIQEFKEEKNSIYDIGTVAIKSDSFDEYQDPAKVKVTVDVNGKALYFSRSPIPYYRDLQKNEKVEFLLHQGVYLYRTKSLERFCSMEVSSLEGKEKLEQLRALENGMSIYVYTAENKFPSFGIDTIDDLRLAEKIFRKRFPERCYDEQ